MPWMRLALRIVLVVAVIAAVIVLVALVAVHTPAGRKQVARIAERQLQNTLNNADVSVGEISGNLLRSPTMRDVTITRDGEPVVTAKQIDVRYDATRLMRGDLTIEQVVVREPVIHVEQGRNGITLFDLAVPAHPGTTRPSRQLDLSELIIVDGRVIVGPEIDQVDGVDIPDELVNLDAELSLFRDAAGTSIDIDRFSARAMQPRLVVEEFHGRIRQSNGGWQFEDVVLRTSQSAMTLNGTIRDVVAGARAGAGESGE